MIRAMLAMTLDGHIADPTGGVGFLDPFHGAHDGLEAFFASVGSLVMGRATYDWVVDHHDWPYEGKPTAVLTSRPLHKAPPGARAIDAPTRDAVESLAAEAPGDVWLVGGGRTIAAFQRAGLVDRYELGVVPVVLGAGIPLFPDGFPATDLTLTKTHQHDKGFLELWYEPRR